MKTFTVALTRMEFEAKRLLAAEKGYPFVGDHGEVEAKGVKLGYAYSEATGWLTVIVEHVSWVDKRLGYTEEKVAQMLKDMLTPAPATIA